MERKFNHAEAFRLMQYQGQKSGSTIYIWNSRDGVTPFIVGIKGEEYQHVNWQNDRLATDHKLKEGDYFFRDSTREDLVPYYSNMLERMKAANHPVAERGEQFIEESIKEDLERGEPHLDQYMIPVTEKLTKANFWNGLYAKYPETMKAFCTWVDEYKKRVEWAKLFKQDAVGGLFAPKYHDLPIAMQIGIFIQFTFETKKQFDFFEGGTGPSDMEECIAGIKDWFHQEENEEGDEDINFDGPNAMPPSDYELSN